MGVTRFQSQVDVGSSGGADVDKLASSFEKLAGAIEGASGKSDKLAEHPGFEAFAEKVRSGIENPMQAAGAAAEGALKALGPMGTAVSAGVGIFTAFGAAPVWGRPRLRRRTAWASMRRRSTTYLCGPGSRRGR